MNSYTLWQKSNLTGEAVKLAARPSIDVQGDEAAFVRDCFARRGFSAAGDEGIAIQTTLENSRAMTYIEEAARITDEKYRLRIEKHGSGLHIAVTASSRRGLYYAVNAIARLCEQGEAPLGVVEDYPLFALRGIIEGFYGQPWSEAQRTDMLTLLSQSGMNTYYYGPKDDVHHREKWGELYDADSLEALRGRVAHTQACCMDFVYCVGPGITMEYSNETHFTNLIAKLKQVHGLGVKSFGLFLDDIPGQLQFPADQAKYGELVNAHIDLVARVHAALVAHDERIELTVCPKEYYGTGEGYYASKLGRSLPPRVKLFWTGREICSRLITAPEAIVFANSTHHKPLYWDNYPVNDANMYNEMHLGPIRGRDPQLYRFAEGLISNPMEYCESSKVPLLTIADYLWNPVRYDPDESWRDALRRVLGEEWESFQYFGENLMISCLPTESSEQFMGPVLGRSFFFYKQGDSAKAAELLGEYVAKLRDCRAMLTRMRNQALQAELAFWIEKFGIACDAIEAALDFFRTGDPSHRQRIAEKRAQYMSHCADLCDFCFLGFTNDLLPE